MNYTVEQLDKLFKEQKYISNKFLNYAVFTGLTLKKPILVDGPAGVGKTELAKVLAKITNSELIRLQCYEGIDYSKVLYEIDYAKQLSYQNILRSQLDEELKGLSFKKAIEKVNNEKFFYTEEFIIKRPVLKAIDPNSTNPKVLLIDEIDKTDAEVEAMLLEPLSDYSISIPEFGTITAKEDNKPIVVLTSNNSRELSEPLRRRCVYIYIDYPSIEVEKQIISAKSNVDLDFAQQVAEFMNNLRENVNLRQVPSIAESIEWAKLLHHYMGINELSLENWESLGNSFSVLIKKQKDVEKIKSFAQTNLKK